MYRVLYEPGWTPAKANIMKTLQKKKKRKKDEVEKEEKMMVRVIIMVEVVMEMIMEILNSTITPILEAGHFRRRISPRSSPTATTRWSGDLYRRKYF